MVLALVFERKAIHIMYSIYTLEFTIRTLETGMEICILALRQGNRSSYNIDIPTTETILLFSSTVSWQEQQALQS